MTREAAEKKRGENYKSIFAKSIDVDGHNFTAYRLDIVPVENNSYDVVVHLSPFIPPITPMQMDKFLTYPQWKNTKF